MIPLTRLSSDAIEVLTATGVAALFLDRQLRVVNWTPRLQERLNVTCSENRDSVLETLAQQLGYADITSDVRLVLTTLKPIEREVRDVNGYWYTGRVLPCGHSEDKLEGLLLTFTEVTKLKTAEQQLQFHAQRQSFIRELTEELRACGTAREIESRACRVVGRQLRANRVFCLTRQGDAFAPVTVEHCDRVPGSTPTVAETALGVEVLAAIEAGKTPLIHAESDAVSMPDSLACLRRMGAVAQAVVPRTKKGRVELAFVIQQRESRRWTPEEVALIEEAAERTEQALEQVRRGRAMRAAMRRKDEFLATLAHELRNPLTPIRHGLALLRHGSRNEANIERTLDMMERHLLHLVRLVDDVTDGSRMSRGLVTLNKKHVDLTHVVRTALETSHHTAQIEGRQVAVNLCDGPVVVNGDAGRLIQVVSNLLSNALKHTEAHHKISIDLVTKSDWAKLRVRDDGPGIAPDVLPRVFDLFVQADASKTSGLGLGLSLVRDLVRLHGGDVEVHSEGIGMGSEFTVWLPLSEQSVTQSEPPESVRSAPPAEALSGRALIVDDNEDAAETLRMLLKLCGVEAQTAYDGTSALEMFDKFSPNVVYLDIGMPGMDGYEVARRLRQRERGDSVVIVALTGWAQERERRLTHDCGFDHHLVKPVSLQDVTGVFRTEAAPQRNQ